MCNIFETANWNYKLLMIDDWYRYVIKLNSKAVNNTHTVNYGETNKVELYILFHT